MLTVKQIKVSLTSLSYEMIKYVRMRNGDFRFVRAISSDHSSMVRAEERQQVISAGTIVLRRGELIWEGFGSVTLGVSGELCGDDEVQLEKLFGMKFESGW